MATYDSTNFLVPSIRRRAFVPPSDKAWTDQRLLDAAWEALIGVVSGRLRTLREDFFVRSYTLTTVAGVRSYRLPSRALGASARDISIRRGMESPRPLRRISVEQDRARLDTTGTPAAHWLQGADLFLTPIPDGEYTLLVPYEHRPSRLVPLASCAVITSITPATVTVGTSPAGFLTGLAYDVVKAQPPFDVLMLDAPATKAANTYTFTLPVDGAVAVGDYLCLAGESPVIQAPLDVHPWVTQSAAVEATAPPLKAAAMAERERLALEALKALAPRNQGEPQQLRPGYCEGEIVGYWPGVPAGGGFWW